MTLPPEPFALFDLWFDEAKASEPVDPNAMALATVDPDGRPSARIVLLKDWDREGYVFYTNQESRKGVALAANPAAELLFYWKSRMRQIRITGAVAPVSAAQSDAYFASRHRNSRLGAWASEQSRPLDRRETFAARLADMAARFPGDDIPRPPHWGGLRVRPERFEFWEERSFRHHERWAYTPDGEGWAVTFLHP